MQFLAVTVIVALIGGGMHQTRAASIVIVNGQVVKSDGNGITVSRQGGTTTVTDSNGNVVMQSAGNHSGNGISVSSVSGGTSGEACASVGLPQQPQLPELPQLPHVPELPQLPQIPQPAVPAVPGLPGLSKEDLKKAVLEALLQLITQKAQQ